MRSYYPANHKPVNSGPAARLRDAKATHSLVMLPVWLLAHRQGKRVVYTAVNGCTGSVVCDVPVSGRKAAVLSVGIAGGIFALLQAVLTLKPEPLMVMCALLFLLTQYRFSSMFKSLYIRSTRAYEPNFSGSYSNKYYKGPLQQLTESGTSRFRPAFICIYIIQLLLFTYALLNAKPIETASALLGFNMLIAAVMTFVLAFRNGFGKTSGPIVPRLIACLSVCAGLYCTITGQAEDMLFYGSAIAMLFVCILELALVMRAHNVYASRPVPYFEKEADA